MAMLGQGQSVFGFNPGQFISGLEGIFGGGMQDSGAPYDAAMQQYQQFGNQAAGYQNPFYQAGTSAIPQYQNWLGKMQDPSAFINNIMGQYQQSPYAKYLQQQATRGAQNMGSASGMTGSTPLMQFAQQQAGNIASGDMNQWLQNVLGINTQYGSGVGGMMAGGQNAANSLTNMYGQLGQEMGQAAYGKEAGEQSDRANTFGGIGNIVSSFL